MRSKKKALLGILGLFFGIITSHSWAQADLDKGISWLHAQQQNNGAYSLDTDIALPEQATSETLNTFYAFSELGSAVQDQAFTYLSQIQDANTELIARKIIASVQRNATDHALVALLKAQQNSDGSFGTYQGYASHSLDTAWALKALALAGHSQSDEAVDALTWLISEQQNGGNWKNNEDGDDLVLTAQATDAVWHYRAIFNIQNNLDKARQWLMSQQAAGQWNNTQKTAWALRTVLPGLSDTSSVQNAINSLSTAQNANGSWDNDVYLTSICLQAIRHASVLNEEGITGSHGRYSLTGKIVDENYQPIPNVAVSFKGSDTLTNYQGAFSFALSDIGEEVLSINKNGYYSKQLTLSIPNLQSFDLGDIILEQNVANQITVLQGVVTDQNSRAPIKGALVSLSGDTQLTTTTDEYGRYHIEVNPGTLDIEITAYGYHTVTGNTTANKGDLKLFSPAMLSVTQSTVFQEVIVSGRVLDATTLQPIENMKISQGGTNTNITGKDGRFYLGGLAPGDHTYTLSAHGYQTLVFQAYAPINGTYELGDIFVSPLNSNVTPTLEGVITDSLSGVPLTGVEVEIGNNSVAAKRVTTDSNGRYLISGLQLDKFDISFSLNGYETIKTSITFDENAAYTLSLALRPENISSNQRTELKGIVVSADNNLPLSDVVIVATFGDYIKTFTTASDGRFSFSEISSQEATLTFSKENYRNSIYYAFIVPDEENDIGQIRLASENSTFYQKYADLSVDFVDPELLHTEQQALLLSGTIKTTVSNIGKADVPSGVTILAFEDKNNNNSYEPEYDEVIQKYVTSSPILINQTITFDFLLDGELDFRDAPIHVIIDPENDVKELRKDNNVGSTALAARILPEIGELEPELKWEWKSPTTATRPTTGFIVVPTEDTNKDGVINTKDDLRIILLSYEDESDSSTLRIIDTVTHNEILSIKDPGGYRLSTYASSLAAADIDKDGEIEILTTTREGCLLAIKPSGEVEWVSDFCYTVNRPPARGTHLDHGMVSIADLDGDGEAEILFGNAVFNVDGTLRWKGNGSFTGGYGLYQKTQAIAVDLNLDDYQEIIVGASAYDYQGNLLWQNDIVGDGFAAIGNFNDDPYPEIVISAKDGKVYLLNHLGEIIWGPVTGSGWGNGGAPVVADMDGDGRPEIGIAGASYYTTLKADGSIFWQNRISDISSSETGSTVFDFDGDGRAEVVYADEENLYIYDGENGDVLYKIDHSSNTTVERPVIVDIDNDGHADLVLVQSSYYISEYGGIRVYQGKNNSWVRTRSLWNQYDYYINNINDDLTVPTNQGNSWQIHNTFYSNLPLDLDPTVVADLSASYIQIDNQRDINPSTISVRVGNGGGFAAPQGISVAFYNGNPETGGELIGTTLTPISLSSNEYVDVSIGTNNLRNIEWLYIVVDDDGTGKSSIDDANRNNNTAILDLKSYSFGSIKVTTDQQTYLSLDDALLEAEIRNLGFYAANFSYVLSILDEDGNEVIVFSKHNLASLAPNEEKKEQELWSIGNIISGEYTLRGELFDEKDSIIAEDRTTFTILAVAAGSLHASLRVTTDRVDYEPHDQVMLGSLARNLSTNMHVDDAQVDLVVHDPNQDQIHTHSETLGQLAANGTRTFEVPQRLQNAPIGAYTVTGTLKDKSGAVLATANTTYNVGIRALPVGLTGDVTVSQSSIYPGDAQTRTDMLMNNGATPLDNLNVARVLIKNSDNAELTRIDDTIDLAAGGSQQWNDVPITTGALTPGSYTVAILVEDSAAGTWDTLATASFTVLARQGQGQSAQSIPSLSFVSILILLLLMLGIVAHHQNMMAARRFKGEK